MKQINISSLVRENVKTMKPYSSARDEFQGVASVFLDANENPFPSDYNRYPDPQQVALKDQIAKLKDVLRNQILLGNGSDEPIDLLIRAFCEPHKDNVVIPQPTYGMYSVSANVNAVEIKTTSLTSEFDIDVDELEKIWNTNTKIIFLCSPNNPSGNLLSERKIKLVLEKFNGLVVVDEAYIDFTKNTGFVPYLKDYNNLVILQTLSKAWGLAALRLGICMAHVGIINILNKIKPPYNISELTQRVALQHLQNENIKDKCVAEILTERERLKDQLSKILLVEKIYPSDANFLLVKVKAAKQTYQALVEKGIIVRDRSSVLLCDNCLRITVGTSEENEKLIEALK
jgi:histidinol-phosphate aminotransferase